jgi:predicted nucleic acid-binding protein
MSYQVCVDASVAIKLVLDESDSDQAQALWAFWLEQNAQVIAPYHWLFETASVIRNNVYRKTISASTGEFALRSLHAQPVQLLHPPQLGERAWELAEQFNRSTAYDCFYLALSELAGCELWMADRRLFSVVNHQLSWVKWLGDFRLSSA